MLPEGGDVGQELEQTETPDEVDFTTFEDASPPTDAGEPPNEETETPVPLRRSTRRREMSRRAMESLKTMDVQFSAEYYDAMHEDDYRIQDQMQDSIAFKATTDPDMLYFHQAMAAPDKEDFVGTIVKEINGHIEKQHWRLMPQSQVPEGMEILDS
eukprot:13104673-Ditylum_brightwellii.AAC.1